MVMFGSPYTSLDVHTPLGMYSNVYTVKAATLLPVKMLCMIYFILQN